MLNDDETSPLIYPSNLAQFNDLWKIVKTKTKHLAPGASCYSTYSTGGFTYDPASFDQHNLAYQTKYKAFEWLIRLEGVTGHDSAADEHARIQCGVDMYISRVTRWVYDAGAALDDIYVNDNTDQTFTNTGLVTNRPVADNQSYSLA